jgi:ubiquitin carboxyl-terminal hydrolase L3
MAEEKRWFPLESNPNLLNDYISNLGFSTAHYSFVDVFSTEEWALQMIGQPVLALVVLFPTTDKILERRREIHESVALSSGVGNDDAVWYVKQRIRNACGTIGKSGAYRISFAWITFATSKTDTANLLVFYTAILHALANTPKSVQTPEIQQSSWLQSYLNKCIYSSPAEKAAMLENDTKIETLHEGATTHGQTNRPELNDTIDMHFVTFACIDERLYELDGRLSGPVCHGNTSEEEFLKDTTGVVSRLMEADPSELRFTMLALASAPDSRE